MNKAKTIAVGSYTIGDKLLGGGYTVFANPFEVEFNIASSRYEYVRIRFEASVKSSDTDTTAQQGGGYAQINYYTYKNIRYKGQRIMPAHIAS